MGLADLVFLKTLLLLWVFCAVVCEHQKRDVHRIIIKQRIPRSQKKSHPSHGHGHGHNHGHSHSGKTHGHGHGHDQGHKKGKRHQDSFEKDASSEDDGSFSRENSFEEFSHNNKGQKSRHQKTPHRHPSHSSSQDYEEKREHHYRDDPRTTFHSDWIPMSSEQIQQRSQESHRDKYRWRKEGKSKNHYIKSLKPPPLEITTSYPFQFDESTSIFPQLIGYSNNAFTNFDLNKKTMESNQSPLIGTIEQPKLFSELRDNRMKNHRSSYEVTELTPASSKINTFISVPDDSSQQSSSSSDEPIAEGSAKQTFIAVKNTQKPRNPRGRGRVTYNKSTKV